MIDSIKTHSISHALAYALSDLAAPPFAHSLKLAHMATGAPSHSRVYTPPVPSLIVV